MVYISVGLRFAFCYVMIANNDGRFGPAIREGHLLRVLCGAALEECFIAFALQQTCQPQVYRWKNALGN